MKNLSPFLKLNDNLSRTTTKYTAIERKQHCDNWKASGLSINEYAQQTGIATSTIHQWSHRQSNCKRLRKRIR
ncbi:MAG: hypothetical protein AB7F64_08755 [Gammaproteobacteria bacterium]